MLLVLVAPAVAVSVNEVSRRIALTGVCVPCAVGAETLEALLGARDAKVLTKPILNVPPVDFEFPAWLHGEWIVRSRFKGYEFSSKIPRERLVANRDIPGFQKLSIAEIADVGADVVFARRYADGKEDKAFNYKATIGAHLSDPDVVTDVAINGPNRATIQLKPGSRNGERLELFTNSRRSQRLNPETFLCSESLRQVTLGGPTLSEPGVPRIVIGEYQHFWTWFYRTDGVVDANLITAAYIEPQDPMFSEVFDAPVVVYAHDLSFSRPSPPSLRMNE
ncbi:hypothetical protein CTAYLR_002194 [Chrysophaeum taylorii]|uniref:DUF6816 domain-containing protein n=1 Tax=Chrysophaeum taylorii TaxID=2483200 RepID=A0AAD7XU78_9STRA|nr:hypothetical protein CTAYLR_002194 [Chrysophaeum taylorii]